MELTQSDIHSILQILRSSEIDNKTKEFSKLRVIKRLEYLKPLILELKEKKYNLKEVCKTLHVEYSDLIFIKEKFILLLKVS